MPKLMKHFLVIIFFYFHAISFSQHYVEHLDIDSLAPNTVHRFWLKLTTNTFGNPIAVPVIVARGSVSHPTLGLTAAIHGNEVNGIKVIHELLNTIDIQTLNGTIIAIPGLNQIGLLENKRRFSDNEDLNRNFPGKPDGNESQQYAHQVTSKILPNFDYLIDMHTASFGRINSLYVRADMSNDIIKQMALLQDADIVLNSKGPSAGSLSGASGTMRDHAMRMNIPAITVEYGDPQIFQPGMIARGVTGVQQVLKWLNIQDYPKKDFEEPIRCSKSYWIYLDEGGILEIPVGLNEIVDKGAIIGILTNAFGEVIKNYRSPERGVVIGKSTNPINMSGGRIIHLGILED